MTSKKPTTEAILSENAELRLRLDEAEETLRAIHSGEVDALVVRAPKGDRIFTLEGAEHPYRILVESMNEGAATLATDGTILYCNLRLANMLQVPLGKLIGTRLHIYLAPRDAKEFPAILERCREEQCTAEMKLVSGNGLQVPVHFSGRLLDQEGKQALTAVITDLTEKKRNDQIIASGNLANSIIEQAGEIVLVCDEHGKIIRASQLAYSLYGKSPLGKRFDTVGELTFGDSRRRFSLGSLLQGQVIRNTEVKLKQEAGRINYFVLNAGRLTDENDKVVGCIVTLTDISARKEAENELQQAHEKLEQRVAERTAELANTYRDLNQKEHMLLQQSRLAAMGEMISNIAHQWRQPLNVLGLNIQKLSIFYDRGLFNKEVLDEMVKNSMMMINHMSSTIDDFRNFFKPDKAKTEFKLREVLDNAIKLIEASFSTRQISIVVEHHDDPMVYGYPNEYSQVILNIMLNAKDAIEARNISNPCVVVSISISDGRSVLTIRDNAGGIPNDIILKIFDPHFTTKGTHGTGIGLFMAKNIIEKNMNGYLTVRNTGDGAEFRIEV